MAVNTANKRFSMMNLGTQPIFPLFPPSGSVDAGDRYHLLTLYSGISLLANPVFTGTIPDLSYDFDSGTHDTDLSLYFTGATSYSISPSVESGWSFNTSTGVLTVDTDAVGTFGPYTVTGTNVSGSDVSNAFSVTVTQAQASGGWWMAYDFEYEQRKRRKKELEEMERKAEQLQNKLDRELALELKKEEESRERINELKRLAELAKAYESDISNLGERVTKAYERTTIKQNYSALEALEREIRKAREEEDWLIRITLELLND